MVDRINKLGDANYWKLQSTSHTKEEKKHQEKNRHSESEEDPSHRDSFGENSDFVQLLSKDPTKYRREHLDTSQISGFTFRGVSTHREQAVVEVDIRLIDGTLIRSAQVALSRQEGMKFLSRKPGDSIVLENLVKGTLLTVALPQRDTSLRATPWQESLPAPIPSDFRGSSSWYYYLGFAVLFLSVLALVYVFVTSS